MKLSFLYVDLKPILISHKPVNFIEILLINEKVNKTDIKRVEMFHIDNSYKRVVSIVSVSVER